MNNNIIIEGPDATGKTWLCDWLTKNYNFDIQKIKYSVENTVDFFNTKLNQKNVAFDRFHLSQFLFDILYNRERLLNSDDMESLLLKIIDTNTIFIIFTSSDSSILKERLIERKEFDYLQEINKQLDLFNLYINYLKYINYQNFYVCDIADNDGYNKLYNWLKLKLGGSASGESESSIDS